MASFVIYQDQENVGLPNNKSKDFISQKRTALGLLNSNFNVESLKLSIGGPPRKENEIDTFRNENESKERLCNRKEKEKTDEFCSSRVPLTEISLAKNVEGSSEDICKESPMTIDSSPSIVDIPAPRKLSVPEIHDFTIYKDDIYKYLRKIEPQQKAKAYYMRRQPDVTYSMRSILVDWLVEVGEEYKLHTQTLFMAVSYIDRFLSCMAVVRAKLQLLGTSAMFIASKFEEIYPPDVGEFTYITDDTYTKKQVLRMEHLILKVLAFELSNPTSYTFVVHLCVTTNLPERVMFLATYICELTLLEGDPYLEFNSSLIASSAIALAQHSLGYIDVWPVSLVNESGYNLFHLAPVVAHLNKTHAKACSSPQGAIREKYKSVKYQQVSQVPAKKLILRGRELQG